MVCKPRNRWERATQVFRWLVHEFDLPADLEIEFTAEIDGDECLGDVVERGGRLLVRLSQRMIRTQTEAVETTIHECAHVHLYRAGVGHFHGPRFWSIYGQMMDAYDHHGFQDSRAFACD